MGVKDYLDIERKKTIFIQTHLQDFVLDSAFSANLYDNPIFNDSFNDNQVLKNDMNKFIKEYLFNIYMELIVEETIKGKFVIDSIEDLKKEITDRYDKILYKNRISVLVVQQIINLYLKYLWCLGYISEPPFCPINKNIFKIANVKVSLKNIDSIVEYENVLSIIKQEAKDKSLAVWELSAYVSENKFDNNLENEQLLKIIKQKLNQFIALIKKIDPEKILGFLSKTSLLITTILAFGDKVNELYSSIAKHTKKKR